MPGTAIALQDSLQKTVVPFAEKILDEGKHWAINLGIAVVILIVGLWLIKRLNNFMKRVFSKREFDASLESFLRSVVVIGLRIVLFISVAGMVGFPTSSFLAIFGAAGLAVGLALQGSLSNFAGGVLVLMFKPFKVGDSITVGHETGDVKAILIFNTILETGDGRTIILPNGAVSNGVITNHSKLGHIRAETKFRIKLQNDPEKLISELVAWMNSRDDIFEKPSCSVTIAEFTDEFCVMVARAHVKYGKQSAFLADLNLKIKHLLEEHNF